MSHSVRVHQTQPGYQKSIIQLVRKSNPSCCYMINFLVKLTFIYDLALMLVTEDVHSPDNGRSQVPFHACTPPPKKRVLFQACYFFIERARPCSFSKGNFHNAKKERKKEAASKQEACGDAKHVLFFTFRLENLKVYMYGKV